MRKIQILFAIIHRKMCPKLYSQHPYLLFYIIYEGLKSNNVKDFAHYTRILSVFFHWVILPKQALDNFVNHIFSSEASNVKLSCATRKYLFGYFPLYYHTQENVFKTLTFIPYLLFNLMSIVKLCLNVYRVLTYSSRHSKQSGLS